MLSSVLASLRDTSSLVILSSSVGFSITFSFLDHSILGMGSPVTSAGMLTGSPALTLIVSPRTARRSLIAGGTAERSQECRSLKTVSQVTRKHMSGIRYEVHTFIVLDDYVKRQGWFTFTNAIDGFDTELIHLVLIEIVNQK